MTSVPSPDLGSNERSDTLRVTMWRSLALVVLVGGIVLSLYISIPFNQALRERDLVRFNNIADLQMRELTRRLNIFLFGLEGTRGIFAASRSIEREEFNSFILSRDLDKDFPGARGFGYIQRIARPELHEFLKEARADGAPQFSLTTSDEFADLLVVKFYSSFSTGKSLLGIDVGTRPAIRLAAESSMRSGLPLVVDGLNESENEIIILLPVFNNGAPHGTEEERISSLSGWVFCTVSLQKALSGISEISDGRVDLVLYSRAVGHPTTLIFDSDGHLSGTPPSFASSVDDDRTYHKEIHFEFGGRTFFARFSTTSLFESSTDTLTPWAILTLGTISSLLLAGILLSTQRVRTRADLLARNMVSAIKEGELKANTLRVNAENSLKRLDLALDSGNLSLWDWDLFSNVLTVDAHLERIIGDQVSDNRMSIYAWQSKVHPQDLPLMLKNMENHFSDPSNCYDCSYRVRHKDGSWVWILSRGRVVDFDCDGRPLRVVGTFLDLTSKMEAEEGMRNAKRILDRTSTLAKIGGWELEADTKKVTWTDEVYVIHELESHTEPPLEKALDFYPPEARAALSAAIDNAIAEGGRWDLELPFITAKGKHLWVRTLGESVIEDGKCKRLVGVIQDITLRKQAEEALHWHSENLKKATIAAETANRTKSEFLANMSHEIRTPMNGIIGLTQLVLDSDLSPDQRDLLSSIDQSAHVLLGIINDILDLSKVEAGKVEISPVEFSLKEIFESVVSLLDFKLQEKRLVFVSRIDETLPHRMVGDEVRIRQILLNLIGNAIKFSHAMGAIVLQADLMEKTGQEVLVKLTVSDTGIGIPQDKRDTIFDPFSQADGGTTRKFGGTGLGLTISKKLVKLMGGKIWVSSIPNTGTSFHLTLPLQEILPAQEDSSRPISMTLNKNTTPRFYTSTSPEVLLVEDNVINQKLATRILEKSGCKVTLARNGQEAVNTISAAPQRFAIVFMDCQMPVLSGFDATREIRALEQDKDHRIPIVAMTANAMDGDRKRCLDSGMDDYLSKPLDRSDLDKVLVRYLQPLTGDESL